MMTRLPRLPGRSLLAAALLLCLRDAMAPAQSPGLASPARLPEVKDTRPFEGLPPPAPAAPGREDGAVALPATCEGLGCSKWLDNLSLFVGLDGAKEPEDLGVNAHFGYRAALNWGLPLWEEAGLGAQVGTAINYSANAVRVFKTLGGPLDRTQSFTTVGVFQRSDVGVNWGVVYDFRHDDYYGNPSFGQVRAQAGYAVTATDELGAWGTLRTQGEQAVAADGVLNLRPINQVNLFWRHVWAEQQVTRFWVGMAQSHGRFLLVQPGEGPVRHPLTFGADVHFPLSDYLAVFGEAQFITPNDTGTVTATFGIAFYPGGGARRAGTNRFAPLLPLGNNTSVPIDARQ